MIIIIAIIIIIIIIIITTTTTTTTIIIIPKNDWFKRKATFARSGKFEKISTFQRNRHFRKMLVNKTFAHVQEQKKSNVAATFRLHPSSVKSPLLQ